MDRIDISGRGLAVAAAVADAGGVGVRPTCRVQAERSSRIEIGAKERTVSFTECLYVCIKCMDLI
jgi:hypothetical protein